LTAALEICATQNQQRYPNADGAAFEGAGSITDERYER
jgi:hypothetical protein